uniref:HNF4 n=1 Tax=Schmidtea mediterranea TaxID=79327 RepID=H8YS99_SCHMD|nr:HNF4 [Schmidtea mediterranea]
MTSTQHPNLNPAFSYQLLTSNSAPISISSNASSMQYPLESEMSSQQHEVYASNASGPEGMENNQLCLICSDKATGKHYGAFSCDGCKGFFRRSVRKKNNYTCQYNRNCKMDKDKRNQCRYCRLKKCILVGMKRAAVQNERDRISTRRSSFDDIPPNVILSISQLMQAEQRVAIQKPPNPQEYMNRYADVPDVCESMKNQLFLLVNWAKSLPCFSQLNLSDQISLLKAHAGEILILGVIRRSFQLDEDDVLLLGNNLIISRNSSDKHFAEIASHILDDLFIPLRELQLDDAEFACLKAIVFFDPRVSESGKEFVRRCRYQIQMDLMNHMNDKQYHKPGRFGELLLTIPDLRLVTQLMVKKVEFMKMTGLAEIDSLLSETLLGDNPPGVFSIDPETDGNNNNNQNDSMDIINSHRISSPKYTYQDCYGIPPFMPDSVLLNINNQNISPEAASKIWSAYLPSSTSMPSGNIYRAFVNQGTEIMQQNSQDNSNFGMIINSDGMMLKNERVGVPSLFSCVNDSINLYQHSNLSQDTSHFLVNLDQGFPMINQSKYAYNGDANHNCSNSSNSDDLIHPALSVNSTQNVVDPSLLVAYTKSLPNSPIENCQIQSIANRSSEANQQHNSRSNYSAISSTAHFLTDHPIRIQESESSVFKKEEY